MSIKFASVDASVSTTLSADNIYFSNKSGFPNTSTGYVTLASLGMTATQTSADTVTITLPDGIDFSWGYFYAFAGAPSISSEYTVISTYTSDVYTTASSTTAAGYKFQSTGGTGFVPMITSSDKILNTSEPIDDVTSWLLNGVTATDVEDGDLSSSVTIQSDGGFSDAWEAKTPGTYTITYTVTDSDGNTTTATSTVIIYSDITVHYVDVSGKTIKTDTAMNGTAGDTFTIDTADFSEGDYNYTYVSANPDTLTGTYGETNQLAEITLTYKWITASDYTMYVGDPEPTATDFKASATDKDGNVNEVSVDLTNADLTKAGTYTVTVTSADGQSKDVTLTVLANQQSITASDYTMYVGDPEPTVANFKASATDKDGNVSEVSVDLTNADLTKAGTYTVTVTSADGQSKEVTLTVLANQQSITASDYTMYVGDPEPTVANFKASATDKDGNVSEVSVDLTNADLTKAGTYTVTVTSADGQSKEVTLTVLANQQSITASDYTMYIGDPEPTVTNFKASATDKAGNASEVSVDLTNADLMKAGTYTVTVTSADGQNTNVKLIVLDIPVGNGTVTTRYVNENGDEIASARTQTGAIGNAYTTSAIDITGYVLDETHLPSNSLGIYTSDSIVVTYVYKKNTLSGTGGTVSPANPTTVNTTSTTSKTLPQTGEETSWSMVALGAVILGFVAYFGMKRRKNSCK
ncbi:bacterial Ig-like domain-containing protein [Enterococcus sp. LJL90]